MRVSLQLPAMGRAARVLLLAFLAALPCSTTAQQPPSPPRFALMPSEQEAYLGGLIRNAPSTWGHGKDWVLIEPFLLGKTVTEPVARTVCPDAGFAGPSGDVSAVPPWIYSVPELCTELVSSHASVLVALEDPTDPDSAYFLFLACDPKRRGKHCDVEEYDQQRGMLLQESNKHGSRRFDALITDAENKTLRFSVAEVWHVREVDVETPAPNR